MRYIDFPGGAEGKNIGGGAAAGVLRAAGPRPHEQDCAAACGHPVKGITNIIAYFEVTRHRRMFAIV